MAKHGADKRERLDEGPRVGTAVVASAAAIVMIFAGALGALEGLMALVDPAFFDPSRRTLLAFDAVGWGWTHLILGAVVVVAGFGVLNALLWARVLGIALAVVSAVAHFLFLPQYPFWSTLLLALDILVIWALCRYSRDVAERNSQRF